jgi:hypothetical protein
MARPRARAFVAILEVTLLWTCPVPGQAADITLNAPARARAAGPEALPMLRLTGRLETGDADKLRAMLAKLPVTAASKAGNPLAVIELSSIGGSLTEGFEIGLLLKERKVIAVVRKRDLCLSSCALAFLGGNAFHVPSAYPKDCNLEIGGKVAFHNFSLNRNGLRDVTSTDPVASRLQGFSDARGGAAELVKYAGELGLPPNLVSSIIGRPTEDFQYIKSIGQFLSLRICPIGVDRPPIALPLQATNVCNHSTGWRDPELLLEAREIPVAQAKQYMLERVQEDMRAAKARGRLADQLGDGAVMRVKEEIDRLYDDLRAAGVALPEILGATFEIGRQRAGGYEVVCYVSLSPGDPDKYDVVVRGARGLTDPTLSPPENARRLFLFSRDDMINPGP